MENKKVFIGNLNFEVTEGDVKDLLSKYGTVVKVQMHQKKGYAFVEMEDAAEAAKAIQKLEGIMFKNREIHISMAMKAGKAKSISVRKYKERGKSFSGENAGRDSENRPRSEKYRNIMQSGDGNRQYGSSYERSGGNSANMSAGELRKGRPGLPRPERDRWSTERPDDRSRPPKKEWSADKPSYPSRPARDGERDNYNRPSRPQSDYRSGERSSGSGNRPVRDYTKERSGTPGSSGKEWTPERPSRSSGKTSDRWKERPGEKKFSGERTGDYSKSGPRSGSQNRLTGSSRAKPGGGARKSSPGTSGQKPRGSAGNSDRDKHPKRD